MATFTLTACQEEEPKVSHTTSTATTTTDNGSGTKSGTHATGTGKVTLQSAAYSATAAAKLHADAPLAATADITDFQFCVTKMSLANENGNAVLDENGDPVEVSAVIGLVDVSNSTVATTWDTLTIPTGFEMSEMNVEVHLDPENCGGAAYSLSYNGTQLTKDLEFTFNFDPAITVGSGDVLSLALDSIATTFQTASEAGQLTDELIGNYVESLTSTAEEATDGDATAKVRIVK